MASKPIELKDLTKVVPEQRGVANGWRQVKTTRRYEAVKKEDPKMSAVLQACRDGRSEDLQLMIREQEIVNHKIKGTTLLHEACCHGNLECVKVLMKAGADPNIWDQRGFTPAHCSAYNNHLSCLQVLLDFIPHSVTKFSKATSNTASKYGETPLHISCLRGHLKMSQFLVHRDGDLTKVDQFGNTILHYAASSNNGQLAHWLLKLLAEEDHVNVKNQFGQTPAHRASILGCPSTLSVLAHHHGNFSIQDTAGYTPVDLARLLGNMECYDIGRGHKLPRPLPSPPQSFRASISKSMDSLPSTTSLSALSGRGYLPQRSLSNASSCTPPLLRQSSITGTARPRTLSIKSRGSMSSLQGSGSDMYITKTAALQVRSSFKHKKSRSWDNTQQVIYDSTAYEPPPDILFVPPVEKLTLSRDNSRFFSEAHDIKIRVSPDHWPPRNQLSDQNKASLTVDLCVCAAMHLNQPFPHGYTIVSPVFFISCKSGRPCKVDITLLHAATLSSEQDKRRLCILSTTTVNPSLQPDSWSPSDRSLSELPLGGLESDTERVRFRTTLVHPSLYAVAVNERAYSLEPKLPLRCALFVSYPVLESTDSVSGLYVTSYVGMNLKTVHTAVTNQTLKNRSKFEEKYFTLAGDRLCVDAGLTNQSNEWVMTSRDNGEFTYNQLALTQETDKDSYSHLPAYPPHTQFFVEPRGVAAAVKCRVRVLSVDGREISYIRVIPFSPTRELTPPPSSYPLSTHSSLTQTDSKALVTTV